MYNILRAARKERTVRTFKQKPDKNIPCYLGDLITNRLFSYLYSASVVKGTTQEWP